LRLKILFCNYEYPPLGGGGGVVMAALARELARRHDVTVLTSRALDLPAESLESGVRILRVPVFFRKELAVANFPSMLAYLPTAALRGLSLKRERYDVINTHFVVPTGPLGQFLARYYGVPNVLSVHGGDLYDPSKRSSPHRHSWLRRPIRNMLMAADALVGQSRNTLEHVDKIYGVQRPTELIPLGIDRPPAVTGPRTDRGNPDPGEIKAAARAALRLPGDAFVMVTIGRLVARKSTTQLVRALQDSGRDKAHLLIVGDGPDAAAVEAAAVDAGLRERVHLLGYVTDEEKYRALAAADIFVSSSQHEGFGLVFLEAMAFGLPVICYDHGGQTDFLATGRTGHLIQLNDLTAFTRAICDLHDRKQARLDIGRSNLSAVEDYFIDRCAARYETVFDNVCAGRLGSNRAAAVHNEANQ
jgi:glycosyltransferase involved in cell wall biosynthesis